MNTQPAGWDNFLGYNYNSNNNTVNSSNYALVDNSRSYNGEKSIRFSGSLAQIVRELPSGIERLHLRAYVNLSAQMGAVIGDNHEHIMGVKKTKDANNEIRVGQIKGTLGTNEVPSDNIAPKQALWESGKVLKPNEWYCIETAMYKDTDYDELYLWVGGELVHSITSATDWQNGALPANWMDGMFNYVMFGFQSFSSRSLDVWMDDIVVATGPVGCGAVNGGTSSTGSSDSSSSAPSVSSASSFSSSSAPAIVGDLVAGKAIYANCVSCHGNAGQGTGSAPALDPNKQVFSHSVFGGSKTMESFIGDYMVAFLRPCSTTVADCAGNVAAYIRNGFSTDVPVSSSSSSLVSSSAGNGNQSSSSSSSEPGSGTIASCDVNYGPRSLRLLTSSEFANSVEDLTGVNILRDLGSDTYDTLPADIMISGFSNNTIADIQPGSLQGYNMVVNKIVDHLAANNFASVISCSGLAADACGEKLMENFAPKVMRRAVTQADKDLYRPYFDDIYTEGNINEGLRLAVRSLLVSADFLYRDETGVPVSSIVNDGSGGETPQLIAGNNPVVIYNEAFDPSWHTGGHVPFVFAGNSVFTVKARATKNAQGQWPKFEIHNIGDSRPSVEINSEEYATYTIFIENYEKNAGHLGFSSSHGPGSMSVELLTVVAAQRAEVATPPVVLDDDAYILTPYQMASYLAFTFTGSTPDATLLQAAADGKLATKAQVEAQVERLLATPRARQQFGSFAAQWLRTDRILTRAKDAELLAHQNNGQKLTQGVRDAMAQEIREIFNHVVLDEAEPFTSMYDGDYTFVNGELAKFYGIGNVSGTAMQKVSTSARGGLPTTGAFLSVNAHQQETAPILRSVYFRRGFMCHYVPEPPTGISLIGGDEVNVDEERQKTIEAWQKYLDENGGIATARKKYEFQTSGALCAGCHEKMINPLGGGMEDFNAVGLPQTSDYNGLPVNANGTLFGVTSTGDGQQIDFHGVKQLAHAIAGLDVTRNCFIDNSFRLAMGTGASNFDSSHNILLSNSEKSNYSCEVKKLESVMKTTNNSTKAMLKALGSMDAVRYRKNVQR